jgi:hypothetical protein
MKWDTFVKDIFKLQNKIRINPKAFIGILEKSMDRFYGNILKTADGCSAIETEEGPLGFVEAIEFLKVQKPVPPLVWCSELQLAAKDHVVDIGKSG